jgi:hypothetical protein
MPEWNETLMEMIKTIPVLTGTLSARQEMRTLKAQFVYKHELSRQITRQKIKLRDNKKKKNKKKKIKKN